MSRLKVTEDTTIAQLLEHYPEVAKLLKRRGLDCVPCSSRVHESVRKAAIVHGLDPQELLQEIKKIINHSAR